MLCDSYPCCHGMIPLTGAGLSSYLVGRVEYCRGEPYHDSDDICLHSMITTINYLSVLTYVSTSPQPQDWPTSISEMGARWNNPAGRIFPGMTFVAALLFGFARMGTDLLIESTSWDSFLFDVLLPMGLAIASLVPIAVRTCTGCTLMTALHTYVAGTVFILVPLTLLIRSIPSRRRCCCHTKCVESPMLSQSKYLIIRSVPYRWWIIVILQIIIESLFIVFAYLTVTMVSIE